MNITLLGHHDIASLYALDRIIRQLPEHQHAVLLSSAAVADSNDDSPLAELAEVDKGLCSRFLSGDLDGPVVAPLADGAVGLLDKPNSPEGLAVLGDRQPDLVVSIRYRRILHDVAIAIPRLGVLNLHSGILPDYRGVMVTFWAMLSGDKEIGTTLHWIVDAGIDTGPVLDIRRRATRPDRSYLANVLGLYADGCDSMTSAIATIAGGEALPGQVQVARGQYFTAPDANDAARFKEQGYTLVDGSEEREIRATTA